MKKPGLVARQLPGSVTAIRRPNIPKYLQYKHIDGCCQVQKMIKLYLAFLIIFVLLTILFVFSRHAFWQNVSIQGIGTIRRKPPQMV